MSPRRKTCHVSNSFCPIIKDGNISFQVWPLSSEIVSGKVTTPTWSLGIESAETMEWSQRKHVFHKGSRAGDQQIHCFAAVHNPEVSIVIPRVSITVYVSLFSFFCFCSSRPASVLSVVYLCSLSNQCWWSLLLSVKVRTLSPSTTVLTCFCLVPRSWGHLGYTCQCFPTHVLEWKTRSWGQTENPQRLGPLNILCTWCGYLELCCSSPVSLCRLFVQFKKKTATYLSKTWETIPFLMGMSHREK